MAEDIKLVIGTDNPTIVVTTVDKVNIRDSAKSSEINFVATGSSGIKGDTGPQGPAGTGITTEQAAAIDTNTAKNSFDGASINKLSNIQANAQVNRALLNEDNMASDSDTLAPTQQSVKAYVDGQTHLQIGTNSTNALAGNTTTISTEQASAIIANTSKTGITTSQASAIVTNTAKTGITTSQASAITANTAKTGITTSQANAITANTAKPDLTVDGAGTVHSNNYTDTVYTHPSNHAISVITGLQTALNAKQDSIGNEDLTIQQTDGLQDALDAKVDDSQVLTNVPANAVFTDTVYTHPTNHAISVITGLQTALDSKQDGIGSEDLTIAMTDGLQAALDAKVDDSQVLTNVPANAVFTDTNTTYSVQDGELSQNNFTDADHTKLNNIEASADVTDTANVTSSGALMDSELTDLAGVKGVTISTLQVKPSEGGFANGDKTKLDNIEASATADQTKADIDSLGIAATTAVSLTAGDKIIDGNLGLGGDDEDSHYVTRQPHTDNDGGRLYIQAGASGGTNKPGGSLLLQGGASTGNASGGSIVFTSSAAGSSGSSANSVGLLGSISSSGNLSIEGDLTVKGNDIQDNDGTTCITFDSSGNTTVANTLNATLTGNVTGSRLFNKSSTSNNNLAQGDIIYVGGGSTTAGDLVYMKTNGEWGSAQANAASTSTSLLGIALGTDPDVNGVLLRGTYTLDHDIGNNQGVPLYISDGTAGQATVTIPNTSGDIIRIIGYNIGDDDEIWFNPDKTFIEV